MRLAHFLLLGVLLAVLLSESEAGCKGSKCRGAKRRKNEEERREGNDPLGQVEDIEGKKKEKAKSEEESEEKEEEKKAVVAAASRRRRAEKELQRDRELGESQGTAAHGKHRGSHNSHNHNHAHRRRHVTGHEHTHSKEEGEQARAEPNGKSQRLRRAEKLAEGSDFAFGANNKHSKRFLGHLNKQRDALKQSEEGGLFLPLRSFGRRHVTGEDHTHSSENHEPKPKGKRSRSKKSLQHHHHNGDPFEQVPNPLEDHRVNMERRRYPIGKYGPFGKERVLPLPIPNKDYWDNDVNKN